MASAQYYALLARALPGTCLHDLRWNISLVWGWSLIHAAGILAGEVFIWPDPLLSSAGRSMLKVAQLREEFLAGRWRPQVDL